MDGVEETLPFFFRGGWGRVKTILAIPQKACNNIDGKIVKGLWHFAGKAFENDFSVPVQDLLRERTEMHDGEGA
eukprot:5658969-Prorocentrum_lima.AAC.1